LLALADLSSFGWENSCAEVHNPRKHGLQSTGSPINGVRVVDLTKSMVLRINGVESMGSNQWGRINGVRDVDLNLLISEPVVLR